MLAWLADAARCTWALLYWNARKSSYVLGGRSGRCPCQNPSDIGGKGGVRCDASLYLNEPLRFRRVCPLVVSSPNGRGAYCSVAASEVRPFWGRAVKFFALVALGFYLVSVTSVFVGLRSTGLRTVSWFQVGWPGSWDEIPKARSAYFFQQALTACARGDYPQAYQSMLAAVALDRSNYPARLFTAQYAAFAGEMLSSDALFAIAVKEFPEHRDRTVITWHDSLLAVARYDKLARFSLEQAGLDQARRSVWVGSMSLAMRLGRLGATFLKENQAAVAGLGPDAEPLVRAAAAIADNDGEAALTALRYVFPQGTDANYVMQQIQLLLMIGVPRNAEIAWNMNGGNLQESDRLLARSWVDAGLGYRALATLEFSAGLDRTLTHADWDKLAATLVMQPDREAFLAFHRRAIKEGSAMTLDTAALMWVSALVVGAEREREYWLRYSLEQFRVKYPPVTEINFRSLNGGQSGTVPFLVGILPLGRATIASLYERVEPPPPPPVKPVRK